MKRRALAAAATAAAVLALAGCHDDVYPDAKPKLWVDIEKAPDLNRMHITIHIVEKQPPQQFDFTMIVWKFDGLHNVDAVAKFHRYMSDLPGPNEGVTWRFPDDIERHGKKDKLLICKPGRYFTQWVVTGIQANGTPQSSNFYYPYNLADHKYADKPSGRRSWQVNCNRAGQVRDPAGE